MSRHIICMLAYVAKKTDSDYAKTLRLKLHVPGEKYDYFG